MMRSLSSRVVWFSSLICCSNTFYPNSRAGTNTISFVISFISTLMALLFSFSRCCSMLSFSISSSSRLFFSF